MNARRIAYLLIACGFAVVGLSVLISCGTAVSPTSSVTVVPTALPPTPTEVQPASTVAGSVVDSEGAPLAGATVRVQATTKETLTDAQGRFTLTGLKPSVLITITAWKDAYYCDKVETVTPPASNIKLVLRDVQSGDNGEYAWIPPTGENSCYSCKPGVTQVWLDSDAHGKSASNPRFLTMYSGMDVNGNRSPSIRYGYSRDYGRIPLRPDPTQPYFGPGYKLDFPDTAGNCAACHVPGAAIDDPYGIDPLTVSGANTFGIHCDYCHKVGGVNLDPITGLPFPNMPGVLSQDIRRPFPEDKQRYQIFFGSFDDDNVPMEDTYLPLIKESQWCAPCHFGVFWDTVVYNSFGEWLASPYSRGPDGKTCQQCHMPAPTFLNGEPLTNVAPGKGGVERDPQTIPAHTFPGASSLELLQNSVTMKLAARRMGDQISVEVSIVNDRAGHHVPTDSPLRQMILLVDARDPDGTTLLQVGGPTVPEWGGVGDPAHGFYAGLPGKIFAKTLTELWTEVTPTGAYWNLTRIASDTRIPALGADTSTYVFQAPAEGEAAIDANLLFRRAFKELMQQKGWTDPDILMEHETTTVP